MMHIDDVVITCCRGDCGISFAVPQWWHRGKRETHACFYCPNGHQQRFLAESETEKMRRERDNAMQQLARAEEDAAKALRDAGKAQRETKRLKRRAAAGTCPCCKRTFSNMSVHIRRQHPEFVAETGANVVPINEAAGRKGK